MMVEQEEQMVVEEIREEHQDKPLLYLGHTKEGCLQNCKFTAHD